jgi:FkbM family methyltransferase
MKVADPGSSRGVARWRRIDEAVLLRGGLHLRLDPGDSLGLGRTGTYEPFESELLCGLIRPGTAVVDVGANIGYYTLQFSRATGPRGRVFAIEPDPDNLRLLRHNLRTSGQRNVVVVAKALAGASGTCRLFLSAENRGDHRLYDSGDDRRSIEVEAVALDDLLEDHGDPIALVKLDIQGAEPLALAGMTRLLSRHPETWLATEYWPAGLVGAGSSAGAYLDALRNRSPVLLRIDERRRRIVPLDMTWLSETVTVERGNHTNFLVPPPAW